MANTTGKKFGGRQKGTPNKSTAETKELLSKAIGKELERLGSLLTNLDNKDRISAIVKFLPYIIPKQISHNNPDDFDESVEMSIEQIDARIEVLKKELFNS